LLKKKRQYEDAVAAASTSADAGDNANSSTGKGMVRYNLTDNVYAKAEIDYAVGTVNLWMGANVMLEFTYEDAVAFLETNRQSIEKQLREVTEDLAFVRDQIVTSEVNISRLYNWDVIKKKQQEAATAGAGASNATAAATGDETK